MHRRSSDRLARASGEEADPNASVAHPNDASAVARGQRNILLNGIDGLAGSHVGVGAQRPA